MDFYFLAIDISDQEQYIVNGKTENVRRRNPDGSWSIFDGTEYNEMERALRITADNGLVRIRKDGSVTADKSVTIRGVETSPSDQKIRGENGKLALSRQAYQKTNS